jgi:hypothetical protein
MNQSGKGIAERSMAISLRMLSRVAGSEAIDRIHARKPIERALYKATKNGFRSATAANRAFKATQKLSEPARQTRVKPPALFDLTPDDEQQMLKEAIKDFSLKSVRPSGRDADEACMTPPGLLAQADELQVNTLGVPQELGV